MSKKFWNFKNSTADTKVGELTLYGDISSSTWYGDEITPKQFKEDLDGLGEIEQLNVYINSGGGDVFAGQAIYSMLKRKSCTVTVYIDGLAASIASVIAMAGDTVIMPKNAMLMIHNAWTIAYGNKEELRKIAEDMEKIDESIVGVYADKSGKNPDEIKSLMDAETWFTAEEAVASGFADKIEEEKQIAASLNSEFLVYNGLHFSVSRYSSLPKDKLNLSDEPQIPPAKNSTETPEAVLDSQDQALLEQKSAFNKIKKKLLEV